MKAIVYTEYGSPDVLKLQEVQKPDPKSDEILIKNYAATVNYGDITARNFANIPPSEFHMPLPLWLPARIFFGISKPVVKILGSQFAGEIESVGKDVKKFKKGDRVFGYLGQRMGSYAEYISMPEEGTVTLMPSNMNYKEASVVTYGSIMALNILRKVNIQPGQKVLINGASGGIGSAAVQLAKNYGAEVTGVCGTPRMEFVKAIGADKVIDYSREDFTQSGEKYDLIFDILGKSSFSQIKNSLKPNGRFLLASFKMKKLLQMLWTSIVGGKKVICALSSDSQEDLIFIRELIEAGKIKSVIDRTFTMEQAAEAHRYIEEGNKKGNIVLTMGNKD
ncbi:NAD(P)-dependent alcohol dehydrogenase [Bacteroidota bacterium]